MNLNTKKSKLTCNQTNLKALSLEARHTKSIEASNKIRLSLSPKLFIPRGPDYRYSPKSFNSKSELKKQTFKKDQELKNFRRDHMKNGKSIIKQIKEKCAMNLPPYDKNCKANENNKNDFSQKTNAFQTMKKYFTKKINDINSSLEKSMSTKKITAKEAAINNWGKLKVTADKNSADSAKNVTESEIKFMENPYEIKTSNKHKDINTNDVQQSKISVDVKIKTNIKMGQSRKRTSGSKNLQTRGRKMFKLTSNQNPEKVISNTSSVTTKPEVEKDFITKISNISSTITNGYKIIDLEDFAKNVSNSDNVKENIGPPANLQKELICLQKTVEERITCPQIRTQSYEMGQQTLSTLNNSPLETIDDKNKNLQAKETEKSNTATNSSETRTPNSAEMSTKNEYFSFRAVTTEAADFQQHVRSSISLIYDCSPIDQQINDDLLSLSNSDFSKYVGQTRKGLEDEELKTKNCLEYIKERERINLERQKSLKPGSFLYSCLQPPKNTAVTSDTITILIESDISPTESITFKTCDILNATQINNNISQQNRIYPSEGSGRNSNEDHQPHSTYKDPTVTPAMNSVKTIKDSVLFSNTSIQNQTNNQPTNNTAKKKCKQHLKRLAEPPKIWNPLNTSTQIPTPSTATAVNATNAHNVIYTQAQMHHNNTYSTTKLLRQHRPGNRFSSLTNQAINKNPIGVANSYNYTPSPETVNNSGIPVTEYDQRINLYPPHFQTFNRAPIEQPNENILRFEYHNSLLPMPFLQNHYLQHVSASQNFNSKSIEVPTRNILHYEYHKSLGTMPFLQNHYLPHGSESEIVNNFNTTNLTANENNIQYGKY